MNEFSVWKILLCRCIFNGFKTVILKNELKINLNIIFFKKFIMNFKMRNLKDTKRNDDRNITTGVQEAHSHISEVEEQNTMYSLKSFVVIKAKHKRTKY